jgi:predicted PurR-regulated permease PerM
MAIDLQLTERQQLAIVTALTILAVCVILGAVGGTVFLVSVFFRSFSGVFLPLILAAFLALVIKPYYDLFTDRLKLPAAVGVAIVFVSFLLPLSAFFWFFGAILVSQLTDLVERLPEYREQVDVWIEQQSPRIVEVWERWGMRERLSAAIDGQQEALVSGLQSFGEHALSAGAGVLRGIGTILGWAVMPVYFAFFLLATPSVGSVRQHLPFLKEGTRDDVVYLFEEFVDIVVAFFRGQLLVALAQGVLFALGFSIVRLHYGLVLGLLLGFLNIIPYLGSIVGLSVCLPLALFQESGGWSLVLWVLVVFTVVQMIEGYVLTPRIMGQRTGLHPMAIIVAIFFWGTALGGITGMILAIPLTAFGVVFWRLAKEKYIGELV